MAIRKLTNTGERASWRKMQKRFLLAIAVSFLLLQVLFLGNMCYLYATQFHDSDRSHSLRLLYVDYDGGVIGQSVLDTYQEMRGPSFPTLEQFPSENYPLPTDVKKEVCNGKFWGAIYSNAGASANLTSILANGTSNDQPALTYIWNGARYPAFSQSIIYSSIVSLVQGSRDAYYAHNASNDLQFATLSNQASLQAFLNPITASEINIKPTNQGPRVLYNTVSLVMPIIQQFFFMMALNGISMEFQVLRKFGWIPNGVLRMCISIVYTFTGSLAMVGYIWIFKESWDVNANQFVLCWMIIWLFMHINFLVVDILTTFIPMQFLPFCVLTWVIVNVASTISPFELSPGFFRWGYALPAHETYQVLVQIWSDGCNGQLYRALPILFGEWVLGVIIVIFSVQYRCKTATSAEQADLPDKDTGKHNHISPPIDGHVSPQSTENVMCSGQNPAESVRLERAAYGPSYPTPLVHHDGRN
ncbi:hypothetical protein BDV24DRAFT_158918 [Aspergillus arachidicola]|uniref:DUF3533 domain-containing protein n=1 Tax=Aspergillus arachidicola TaxID=656916 RepID=A0A5N6YL61_9EURO|nr:hypothetical protein BDV24DRAFT_158918 [Aspergillus arachidicola]